MLAWDQFSVHQQIIILVRVLQNQLQWRKHKIRDNSHIWGYVWVIRRAILKKLSLKFENKKSFFKHLNSDTSRHFHMLRVEKLVPYWMRLNSVGNFHDWLFKLNKLSANFKKASDSYTRIQSKLATKFSFALFKLSAHAHRQAKFLRAREHKRTFLCEASSLQSLRPF